MTNPPRNHLSGRAPQIVPKGYWTFWCALSILGGIGGAVTAFLEHSVILGVISFAWGIAWGLVYRTIRRETKSA